MKSIYKIYMRYDNLSKDARFYILTGLIYIPYIILLVSNSKQVFWIVLFFYLSFVGIGMSYKRFKKNYIEVYKKL